MQIIFTLLAMLAVLVVAVIVIALLPERRGRVEHGAVGASIEHVAGLGGSEAGSAVEAAAGGYGGVSASASAIDTVDSEELGVPVSYSGGPREPIGAVKSKLLLTLVRMQSIPFEELQARVQADREVILQALRELESKGLVHVEGGMVVLSEHGAKIISTLREKYAEKEAWYENI